MIFDWKNNKEEAMENGIYVEEIINIPRIVMSASEEVICGHTFRNFDTITFEEGTNIENCVFEDCGEINFNECEVDKCSFSKIDTIFAYDSNFTNSSFKELVCDNDMIISLEDSKISYCSFEDVELREESYLCEGVGESLIEHSSFSDIRTSREDKEIVVGEETVGKIFKYKVQISIIDEESCIGLENISYTDQ